MNEHKQVVFLIGAARSGTTLLGEQLLSNLPGVNYVGEKNWVWKYGNVYYNTDELNSGMLTKGEKEYIVSRFDKFLHGSNEPILIEKTPSNTLRLPLLLDLFPAAKFIFLFREGSEVARSSALEWAGISSKALDSKKIRKASPAKRVLLLLKRESDLVDRAFNLKEFFELPYYFYRFLRNFIKLNLNVKSFSWGPMNKDINSFRKEHNLLVSCAYQWKICTENMLGIVDRIPPKNRMLLHFDELKKDSTGVLKEVGSFLGLPIDEKLIDTLSLKVKGGVRSSIEAEEDVLNMVTPVNLAVEEALKKERQS